jgi:hypothetical protein
MIFFCNLEYTINTNKLATMENSKIFIQSTIKTRNVTYFLVPEQDLNNIKSS